MANILFISPYYPPEKGAAAVCVSENTKRLVKLGHHVTVLTTVPNYPTGIVPPEYRGHLLQREVIDGVDVVRAWSYTSANKGFLRRILAQLSFGCLAPLIGNKAVGQPDIILVQSPPLLDAVAVRMMARLKRRPFIFMTSDLWPEAPVQLGMLHNPILISLAEWLARSTYKRAVRVWAVTEGMRVQLLELGLAPEDVFLLPNGVDTERFVPLPKAEARKRLGWAAEPFTVLYAGTHGLTHGLLTVLDAAERLREHPEIRIVLAGDGADKERLVRTAWQRGLSNVTFLDPLPHALLPVLLCAADVCLVHMRKMPVFDMNRPIKMLEAMSCARPILLGINGEARRIAEQEAEAAYYVEQENPEAMANGILYFAEHREEAEAMGKRGRPYAESHFSYDVLASQLDVQIRTLLDETPRGEKQQRELVSAASTSSDSLKHENR